MIGDRADLEVRLRRLLPASWFGTDHPILSALLAGFATALASLYDLIAFTRRQARIATAEGGWLDMAAQDFFGRDLPRLTNETDAQYRLRVRREVFRDRNTRNAIIQAVRDLTGEEAILFEGFYPADTMVWGRTSWGRGARWGSYGAPYEVIVHVPYPEGYGVAERHGWGTGGSWGTGNFSWAAPEFAGVAGLADILRAIDLVRAAGITIYVRFYTKGLPSEPES